MSLFVVLVLVKLRVMEVTRRFVSRTKAISDGGKVDGLPLVSDWQMYFDMKEMNHRK